MTYDLFLQGPAVYLPVIILSLIVTLIAYGAFPVIFSKVRKKVITKRKYTVLCYAVNFLAVIFFVALNGEASSGGAYFLWTSIFSAKGVKELKSRGVLEGSQPFDYTTTETHKATIKEAEVVEEEVTTEGATLSKEEITPKIEMQDTETIDSKEDTNPVITVKAANGKTTQIPAESYQQWMDAQEQIAAGNSKKESKMVKTKKRRFCKFCGGEIDSETKKCSSCGKQYFHVKVKGFRILPVVLSVLLIFSIGLNVVQYITSAECTKTITDQEAKIKTLQNTVLTQKNTIVSLEEKGEYFDLICKEFSAGNSGYAANNFRSSESIIVVDKDETNRKFTLTANWTSGGTVSVDYTGNSAFVDFDNDSWTTSTKMTVEPWKEGITVVTFSNNVDSKTFKILIIVTD